MFNQNLPQGQHPGQNIPLHNSTTIEYSPVRYQVAQQPGNVQNLQNSGLYQNVVRPDGNPGYLQNMMTKTVRETVGYDETGSPTRIVETIRNPSPNHPITVRTTPMHAHGLVPSQVQQFYTSEEIANLKYSQMTPSKTYLKASSNKRKYFDPNQNSPIRVETTTVKNMNASPVPTIHQGQNIQVSTSRSPYRIPISSHQLQHNPNMIISNSRVLKSPEGAILINQSPQPHPEFIQAPQVQSMRTNRQVLTPVRTRDQIQTQRSISASRSPVIPHRIQPNLGSNFTQNMSRSSTQQILPPQQMTPSRLRHKTRLHKRKNNTNAGSKKTTKIWDQYENIDDDLKEEVKEVISTLTKFTVDSSHGILDLFSIFSMNVCLNPVITHPDFLPNLVDKFTNTISSFRHTISNLIKEAGLTMPVSSPSLKEKLNSIEIQMENMHLMRNSMNGDYSEFRNKMIDLVLVSNPDHRFLSFEKSAQKQRMLRKRSELEIAHYHPESQILKSSFVGSVATPKRVNLNMHKKADRSPFTSSHSNLLSKKYFQKKLTNFFQRVGKKMLNPTQLLQSNRGMITMQQKYIYRALVVILPIQILLKSS